MLRIQTILNATDFSPQADHALRLACALARDYKAGVIVTHVRDLQMAAYGEFAAFPISPEEDRSALEEKLAEVKRAHPEVVRCILAEGDPAGEIVALAKSEHCDVIVLGTHGRTGLGRLLMGSVAEQVVRRAPCPVLTMKMPVKTVTPAKEAEAPVAVG
jgi:nucleotide-binding universal stress UspA family protein